MANRLVDKLRGFAKLTDAEAGALEAATANPRTFAARQDLIREGDRPGPVLVILQGWAIRYKVLPNGSRQIMAFLMPGDACDLHIGLLGQMDHSIQTVTEAQVATIARAAMDTLMADHPGVAHALYISQLVDEGTLRAWIISMGRRTSTERVAHLLLELHLRAGNIGLTVEASMQLPLTQTVLADALGMTPVHINRVLQSLRRQGAVELQRGTLRIHQPVVLTRIAGFDDSYLHRRQRSTSGEAA